MKPVSLKNALLEIGSEEIPARFIPEALEQLSSFLTQELTRVGVDTSKIETWGTPRRLVAFLQGIPPRIKDRTDVVVGPPPQAAKNEKGEWTQAALGFAKNLKISVDKLVVQQTPKGERLVFHRVIKGQSSEHALKEIFPNVIKKLVFPKSMIWETEGFRFARPLRWIVALLNSHVIRFKCAGLLSDRSTYGLLALGGKKISISSADTYKTLLQGRCILVDPETRAKAIRHQTEVIGKKLGAKVLVDPSNLQEVVHLTEYPVSILGRFKESFLKLPREVLISSLVKHQKFFPIETPKESMLNAFIGVRNGPSDAQETVQDGYERVINARLSDAQFFFEHDSKFKLEELVPRLEGVGFLEKMGTLLDKTERVRSLAKDLGQEVGLTANQIEFVNRIALLAKADLLTHMVGEFPELQGVAGRFYTQSQESSVVSNGIEQHYWPLTADGALPILDEAAVVSLADKLDTLAAYFAQKKIPSGSADPYGLRRQAIGVVRILLHKKWTLGLETLIQKAFSALPLSPEEKRTSTHELKEFLIQRTANLLAHQGYRSDEIEAVFSQSGEGLVTLVEKLEGLKHVRGRPEFESLAAAIKRARNILKQAQEKNLLDELRFVEKQDFESPTETQLWETIETIRPLVQAAMSKRDFKEAFLALAPLKEPVDAFFEGVMVMVDDPRVRSQRLALLSTVKSLFDSLADFSKLQGSSPS